MKRFFAQFVTSAKNSDTFYRVTKDGALMLDRDALLRSGKMDRQLQAARELKSQAVRKSRGVEVSHEDLRRIRLR
ncbi:hypothetical protein [Luteimonas sp. YGD11-2]|uniref:hypothetical protein n=1 Tax=Luteimonas sp. YGD11-2 TaxID=2508168 RepID=UPI00100BDDAC|nr:hypothetical protein [Luteimonas sp. YGD11-2]